MKTIKSILVWTAFSGILIVGLHLLHAQDTSTPVQSAQEVNSMSDLQVMLQTIESVPPAPAASAPRVGTFYSAQHAPGTRLAWPPLPEDNGLPVWNLGDGIYLLDDLNVNYNQSLMMSPDGFGLPGGGTNGGSPSGYPTRPVYTTNDLWLEMDGITNGEIYITAHNVISGWYQLLIKTNLLESNWTVDPNNDSGVNAAANWPLHPVAKWYPGATNSQMFFWFVQDDTEVSISGGDEITRPSPGFATPPTVFTVSRTSWSGNYNSNLVVHFSLSGTASNVVDYVLRDQSTEQILANNSITILAQAQNAYIELDPTTNLLCLSNLTATLTLESGTNYLPASYSDAASATIDANVFSLVAEVSNPCGMDYHSPSNLLIVSSQSQTGNTWSFDCINASGLVTNWSSAQFSSIGGYEIKLATVKTTANGFTNGTMYFDNGQFGIGRVSPDGSVVNTSWLAMSGYQFLGLYVDQSGSFGTNLVALRSGDGVWLINSAAVSNKLATISDYMEGVIALTNNQSQYGPWAGQIVTGDATDPGTTYLVNPSGQVSSSPLNIEIEDVNIIATNQNFYCNDENDGWVLKVSRDIFTNHVGDVVITVSGIDSSPGLFIVHWNAAMSGFVTTQILPPSFITGFEHGAFAPMDIPAVIPPVSP